MATADQPRRRLSDPKPPNHIVSSVQNFLDTISSRLNWEDLSNDIVMDVGCGNQRVKFSFELLNLYPKVKKILAVDNRQNLICSLRLFCKHPRIEYHCADIEESSTLDEWEGTVSKLVSSHCFHQLKDQKTAFQNVFNLLTTGGDASILFCLNSGFASWHCELVNHATWNRYFSGNAPFVPLTQFMEVEEDHYRNMMTDIGFKVVECKKYTLRVPFSSDDEWKAATFKLSQSSFSIPEDMEEDFKKDLYEVFMKYNGRNENGHPFQISSYILLLLKKL